MDSNKISAEVDKNLDNLFGDGDQGDSSKKKDTLEVERRLDDFFGNENENPAKKKAVSSGTGFNTDNSLLKDLKPVVLSLEWEITDQVMQRLDEEVGKLEKKCKDDKIVVAFLQLLGSLGKYIRKKKADAHPDSISLINSVYDNLEKAMLSEELSEPDKKKMLVAEVNKYKKLKEYIASGKTPSKPRAEQKPEKIPPPRATEEQLVSSTPVSVVSLPDDESEKDDSSLPQAGSASQQDIIAALERINATLKTEFKALREELKLLRESMK